jgi:hypothetical protein
MHHISGNGQRCKFKSKRKHKCTEQLSFNQCRPSFHQ